LSDYGIEQIEMPATPARVWEAMCTSARKRMIPNSV
jgi:hypothetical protein